MKNDKIRKLAVLALVAALIAGALYVNFSRSASTAVMTYGPAMLSMEGAVSQPVPLTFDISAPIVGNPVKPASFDKDVRDLPQTGHTDKKPMREMKSPSAPVEAPVVDAVVQSDFGALAMPSTVTSFAGLDLDNWGAGWPPDTHGDVGPNHYIQVVNTSIGIYNKTGALQSAFTFNTLFGGTGTPCDDKNMGDPIALYDQVSGRWILTDFAWSTTRGPFYECIAVSKSEDPVSGGWWFYALVADASNLNDYPKLGVWSDGIYMSANMFRRATKYSGTKVWALNRADLISGAPLHTVAFTLGTSYFSLLPADMRGVQPPANTPAYFLSDYGSTTSMKLWKFKVNWTTPTLSTFTGPTSFEVSAFTKPTVRVPQLGSTEALDTLGDRLMTDLQYVNINGTEALWVSRTVAVGGVTGIRWYEVRNMSTTPSVYQQGTFQPDSNYRWMPSLAVDKVGNMAVGYSVSSSAMYPAIRYAGRLVTDPLGQLSQGETTMIAGTGSQSGGYNRWGDYSSMSVDPVDGCTFWYTTEYYTTTGNNWQTRIGSFKFENCP